MVVLEPRQLGLDFVVRTIAGTCELPKPGLEDPEVKFAVIRSPDPPRRGSPLSYAHLLAGVAK